MASMREWMRRFWGTIRRNPRDSEMEEEIRSHLELASEDMLPQGSSTEDALRAARLKAGGVAQAMEAMRDQRGLPWLDDVMRDVRHAFRSLRRSPVFTTVALLTLALAIGANTAMFSVLNAVLLRPLPYRSPEQLAMLWTEDPAQNLREGRSAFWDVEQWRNQTRSFADIAAFDATGMTLTGADGAEQIAGASISPNLLPLLGVGPVVGRSFSTEGAEQQQRQVLISYRFWQARFGGSVDALGATLVLNGVPSQIIGVLPASLARRIPTAPGSQSLAWWRTCGGKGRSANRSRRYSCRSRRMLPGAWTFSYEPHRTILWRRSGHFGRPCVA